jgi:threonyl-tRNA synthetase
MGKSMNTPISDQLEKIRHSTSHIMAAAVQTLYTNAKFAIGPTIDNGFYYDFDLPEHTFTPEDLTAIEKKMNEIIKQNLTFTRSELSIKDALEKTKNQPYKHELIQELEKKGETIVSFYTVGDFEDLCRGPHVDSTKELGHFKLTKAAGAYWRGDEKNKMLQRIYGVAFDSKQALHDYLKQMEEAEKRDHRKLGTELELFMFNEEVGAGLPLFLPAGARLRHEIMTFALNTYLKNGYELVATPHIASEKLYEHSGHLGFYRDNMYAPFGIEENNYRLKPMNCPMHVQMYKVALHSYRDLPIRWTEMGTVYRYERSGVLHGLTRVRGFTQDDGHIICTPQQLEAELKQALDLTLYMLNTFGFKEFTMNLSVRDPQNKQNFIGDDERWEKAQQALEQILKNSGFTDFVTDVGGAAFYGPKIDVQVADAIGRKWQLSTIQVDFNLPERFDMYYIDENNQKERPFMIHRALLGSIERFLGVYIEHTAGVFPVWISPVQAIIAPLSEKFTAYAQTVLKQLESANIRAKISDENESLGKRIRNAEMKKVPYILVVGEKEQAQNSVAVRKRGQGDLGMKPVAEFISDVTIEINEKK